MARDLSRRRREAALRLEKLVEAEVNDLAMKARFHVEVTGSDEEKNWTATGFDQVAYMISANPGQPLGAVQDIASGGELSRVMLAIKTVVAQRQGDPGEKKGRPGRPPAFTLVFDEIDTGIGGRAAEAVGRKLKSLGRGHQVLCVTHLPQIASFADRHYLLEKDDSGGSTRLAVKHLDQPERIREVARMLSGARLTDIALQNARQMLKEHE